MSRVAAEVDSSAARFNVAVRAGSARRAVDAVKAYYSGADDRLVLLIDLTYIEAQKPCR